MTESIEVPDYKQCEDNVRTLKIGDSTVDWYYKLVDCDCTDDIICTTMTYSASDEPPVAHYKDSRCLGFEEKRKADIQAHQAMNNKVAIPIGICYCIVVICGCVWTYADDLYKKKQLKNETAFEIPQLQSGNNE